ncbi:MAG TPA: exodeoxyribonuclease III, partial [Gemmatimonadales bacterium]|nr:exodeoxyribonuclease III [Gemmatimonadales bacterium]
MKVATWNVNGIRARAAQVREWLDRERPDVVCLQELKAEVHQIPDECQLEDYHRFWHCRKAYSGVSLLVRRALVPGEPVYTHPPFDMESRIVQVELADLVVASVYVPNGGKDYLAKIGFLTRMIDWVRQLQAEGRPLLVCGDLNIARTEMDVHPRERKPNAVGQRPEERALFETLLGAGLRDLGREFDPDNPGLFTWWAPWRNLRARNIGWRLDYMLASPAVASRATGCVVQAEVGTSD